MAIEETKSDGEQAFTDVADTLDGILAELQLSDQLSLLQQLRDRVAERTDEVLTELLDSSDPTDEDEVK